jgi:glucose-6-phosphate 1-dehydrogenase
MTALTTEPQVCDDGTLDDAIIVVFGATGDLAARKLLPAIANLMGRTGSHVSLIGVGRSALSDDALRSKLAPSASAASRVGGSVVRYVGGSYADDRTFAALRQAIDEADGDAGRQVILYLSVPAEAFPPIIDGLTRAGLHRCGGPLPRLVIEKPFGHDQASSAQLQQTVERSFEAEQVLRVDHYLGKDGMWDLLAMRLGSTIFEPVWNRNWVDHVQITVAETHGVGHRASFYESTGATRDVLQNHVLQLLALTMMDLPLRMDAEHVHAEKLKLLQSVSSFLPEEVPHRAVRGRYARSRRAETYVAARLDIDSPRWAGVPCFVRTGKRLTAGFAEVVVQFRTPPDLSVMSRSGRALQPNQLVVRLQPEEQISLGFSSTSPGDAYALQSQSMVYHRGTDADAVPTDPYERLLRDAVIGDRTLFVEPAEVLQSWRIIDPLTEAFDHGLAPMREYRPGSWGPRAADALIAPLGRSWRNG